MTIIKHLSDITDDLEILEFYWTFSESLKGFKFSENVHTIQIENNIRLSDIDFPKKLKQLKLYHHYKDDAFIGVIFPPNLIELLLCCCHLARI